jgi:hypothetical protein
MDALSLAELSATLEINASGARERLRAERQCCELGG